jgi:hypothetical protein
MPSEDDVKSRLEWKNQPVEFYAKQQNIACPKFNVSYPRFNAIAKLITPDKEEYALSLMVINRIFFI